MVERAHQQRRGRVVHDQRDAEAPADRGDLADREYLELRIRQGLGVVGPGAVVGRAGERLGVGRVDEAHLDALVAEGVGETGL